MSLFNTLNTSISGMAAQANALGTIGDNIANSTTTGYKDASVDFETVLGNEATNDYTSGGVQTKVRYGITQQGTLTATTNTTDLAIKGNGFFVVQGSGGAQALTRAGSFVPDAAGNLVNTAGFKLMGYKLDGSGATSDALQVVNTSTQGLTAAPSTAGSMTFNLPSGASVVPAANLPSTNAAGATYTAKTSLVTYDNLGGAVNLDIYLSKTGTGTWETAVYNKADAAAGGGFPYAQAALTTQTLSFDATTGKLATGSATSLAVPVPNGATATVDLSQVTQLATDFGVTATTMNGTSPSKLDHILIGTDGTMSSVYANGTTLASYRIPLANVVSPNNLTSLTGNVYEANADSGAVTIGTAKSGSLGEIDSSTLEGSTVDLATQLTKMISAQRSYEANSKVIQASSDLLSVITNLHV